MISILTKKDEKPPSEEFLAFSYEGEEVRFDIYLQTFEQLLNNLVGIEVWLYWDESVVPTVIRRTTEINPYKHMIRNTTIEEDVTAQLLALFNAMWREIIYELPSRYSPQAIPPFLWAM